MLIIVPIIMTVVIMVAGWFMYLSDETTWTGVVICWITYFLTAIFDIFCHNLGMW